MSGLFELFNSAWNLVLVVVGFGLIIFVHELGHFLAARWAGIRVLAFSIGFGPVLASYRKGLGWRRGSSSADIDRRKDLGGISPTEYRFSALPLGGYVKMLGQDDIDPTAVSMASDSYQSASIPKRMVVISAGVIFNIISAAILFVIVFMAGLEVEPARIGLVAAGSPAALAQPMTEGVGESGLMPGDAVLSVNGRTPDNFADLRIAAAMSPRGEPVKLRVRRNGFDGPIDFAIVPEQGGSMGLLDIGVSPPVSLTLIDSSRRSELVMLREMLDGARLGGVEPGMRVVEAGGRSGLNGLSNLIEAFADSAGRPVGLVFQGESGDLVSKTLMPRAELETGVIPASGAAPARLQAHLLGLTGVMRVVPDANPKDIKQGLMPGDVFERIGGAAFPSLAQGIAAIRAHSGRDLDIVVQRPHRGGATERVELTVHVKRDGTVGFHADTTIEESTLVALPQRTLADQDAGGEPYAPAAGRLVTLPGSRIEAIAGTPVATMTAIREALRAETVGAFARGEGAMVTVRVALPLPTQPDGSRAVEDIAWALSHAELARLHALGWQMPIEPMLFEPVRTLDRTANPIAAVGRGIKHTHRVMLQTYLTFARLFSGTVKIEHLKGPVGIADLGTRVASAGFVSLLFFMALISVNLAVINFLPLPIVDGGQFLMLIYELVRGRPVPIVVQSVITLAGLVLIGSLFLIVTFNDVRSLLGL